MTYSAEKYEYLFDKPVGDVPEGMTVGESLRHESVANYRVKTIRAGDSLEYEIFPVWNTKNEPRAARAHATSEVQRALNKKNSVKELTRKMNANFGSRDLHITLTYKNEFLPDEATAQRDIINFIRRVKYYRKLNDWPELKYIYVIEYAGTDGRRKRVHQHIIMSAMDRYIIKALWEKGRANVDELEPENGTLEGLAKYITKQPKNEPYSKKWQGSHNLAEPKITTADKKITKKQIELLSYDLENKVSMNYFERHNFGYKIRAFEVAQSHFVAGAYLYVKMFRPPDKPGHYKPKPGCGGKLEDEKIELICMHEDAAKKRGPNVKRAPKTKTRDGSDEKSG